MDNEDQKLNNTNVETVDDDKEWAEALDDFSTEHGVKPPEDDKNKGGEDEDDAAKKAAEEAEAAKKLENETPEQKTEREAKEAAEAEKNKAPVDRSIRDQRATQRELIADEEAMVADIQEQLFADVPKELLDMDGDPIRTIQDVMKLENPATKKAFTEEEATLWLMAAQQNLSAIRQKNEKTAQEYAQVNLSLKDQADNVKDKYGELLKAMPDLAKEVHAAFMETLIKDEKTGIITKAPVSLEKFYDTALKGYVKLAEQLEAKTVEDQKHEEAIKKAEEEKNNIQRRNDRQDIYVPGGKDTRSDEDKEWDAATKSYYGTK